MKRGVLLLALGAAVVSAVAAAAFVGSVGPTSATASSHREAPLIADDPAADNTDVYAFVSPDKPNTVTIIANYIPFEDPAGGPNYYRFDPTVRYALERRQRRRRARGRRVSVPVLDRRSTNPNTFLYNTGPIDAPRTSGREPERQADVHGHAGDELGLDGAGIEPRRCRRRTSARARTRPTTRFQGVVDLGGDRKVFAGPRDDPFFVDLGSIFDLGGLRPFNALHVIPLGTRVRRRTDGVLNYNTHTIAIQVPKTDLLQGADGERQHRHLRERVEAEDHAILRGDGTVRRQRPQVQVSRLGNPLINEVVIPLGQKDYWNASDPSKDSQFAAATRAPSWRPS